MTSMFVSLLFIHCFLKQQQQSCLLSRRKRFPDLVVIERKPVCPSVAKPTWSNETIQTGTWHNPVPFDTACSLLCKHVPFHRANGLKVSRNANKSSPRVRWGPLSTGWIVPLGAFPRFTGRLTESCTEAELKDKDFAPRPDSIDKA